MDKTISSKLINSNNHVNTYIELYREYLSERTEKSYLKFQNIIECSDEIRINIEDINDDDKSLLDAMSNHYTDYLFELVRFITIENQCPEAFYQKLFDQIFCSGIINLSEREYGLLLMLLANNIKGLPYYQANSPVVVSDAKAEEIISEIRPFIRKAMYMADDRFEFTTQLSSQIIDILNQIDTREKKAVLLAILIGAIRNRAIGGTGIAEDDNS
ncbi:hypothetical protein [Butyrivibrio sp. INlla16]|uniref:hypothetical protein n=1 Tax=Butyrivibrio sp. INlla16 TaxID=1520807 RepID=UPI000884C41A|nr:hypothetical protein [Butyrivibrio sp. INlla16]SDB68470.1 hypothetical protein SAMN02910263_04197 [Butyrivibrio sp. INlla16]